MILRWIAGLLVLSVSGAVIGEAYQLLYNMSVLLYFIPFLYMFAAMIRHHVRRTGGAVGLPVFARRPWLLYVMAMTAF